MFAGSTATPQLVIIGKNSRVVFSYYGYIVESDIRSAIESALKEFGDLQQIEKLNNVFLDQSILTVGLTQKFVSLSGTPISYSVSYNSDPGIVNAEIILNDLVLTRGANTGIAEIQISGAVSVSDSVHSLFKVMTYPGGAQVVGFEDGESWSDNIYYLGGSVWNSDRSEYMTGSSSLRTGYIPAPEYAGEVNWTMARMEFNSDYDDTLAFAYKISSQYNSDGFEFSIDDTVIEFSDGRWSGEIDWSFAEFPVKAGNHTVDWDYFKWDYGFAGKDAAWIDIVRIPGILSGIETETAVSGHELIRNYPNPFNSTTVLMFKLKSDSAPFLTVFNTKGEAVIEKNIGGMIKGLNTYNLDFGNFESGTYFYRLKASDLVMTGRMLYLK
jgi:hypothetical protein